MPFVRAKKTKVYFSRYQTKFRRRRQGKTDYRQRRKLCIQDKTKYGALRYRLVVRFTNKDIIAQIAYARIIGDVVLCAAYSHELPRYGVKVGLTNYSAGYCVGLLLARRLLKKLGLDSKFAGIEDITGEYSVLDPKGEYGKPKKGKRLPVVHDGDGVTRPFCCFLDRGLARCTTGARIFSVVKGASDGGLRVPHRPTRFVGYDSETKKFNPAALKDRIFGVHVAGYMKHLQENDPDLYKRQFSRYIKEGIQPDSLEKIYKDAHEAIRKNPDVVKTAKPKNPKHYHFNKSKLSLTERKQRIIEKIEKLRSMAQQAEKVVDAGDEEESEDDDEDLLDNE